MKNVLFVMVDCLRADACWGDNREAVTPVIDSLVAQGTSFSQTIAVATTTSPCVTSILTGCFPRTHGVRSLRGYKLSPDLRTLPEVLAQDGYHTYALMTGPLAPEVGLGRGFQVYECRHRRAYLSSEWGAGLRQKLETGFFEEPWFIFLHLWELHQQRYVPAAFRSAEYGSNSYPRALSALDQELGRLLESMPNLADVLLVLHGDHGERIWPSDMQYKAYRAFIRVAKRLGLPFRDRRSHGYHIHEYLVRVPLLFMNQSSFAANREVSQQVRQTDIFPTLLDALERPMPGPVDGVSLMPLVRGEAVSERPALMEAVGVKIADERDWLAGIRTGGWKYICAPRNPRIPEELYYLSSDAEERHNLARTEKQRAAELRGQLLAMLGSDEFSQQSEIMTEEEMRSIEQRLRDLGYL